MKVHVLLYERPYTKFFFRKVIEGIFNNFDLLTISEYKKCSDIWQSDFLYDETLDTLEETCNENTIKDVINRCRTLRIMDHSRAKRIVRRTWNGIDLLFKKKKIDYVFAMSLDNYIGDILFRLANIYDVPVYSFLGSFAEGYVRFTLRGEHNYLHRDVSEEEAAVLLSKVSKTSYLPPSETESIQCSLRMNRRWFIRRKTIESIYYPLMKIFNHDPDNARFNMLNLKGIRYRDCVSSELESIFCRLNDITVDRKCTVYFPLHFCPEATTDYYLDRPTKKGGYINYILDLLDNSDSDVQFLFKEHPSMFGKRLLSDYKKILEFPNATIIHPIERSNELLDLVDVIVVDNGTVGVESLIRGKQVLALDRSYYSGMHSNLHRIDYVKTCMIKKPPTNPDPQPFVTDLLDGWIKSDYQHSSNQDHYNPEPVAKAIRRMIKLGIRLGDNNLS